MSLQLPPALWLTATDEDVQSFKVRVYNVSDSASVAISAEDRVVTPGET